MPITLEPGKVYTLDVELTPIPPEPARFSGYITDIETGTFLSGATVSLLKGGVVYYQDISDSTGYYNIEGIEAGTYDGLVTLPGYADYPF